MSDPKLPNLRRRPERRVQTNAWLAADRRDACKSAAVVLSLGLLLAAGLWLVLRSVLN